MVTPAAENSKRALIGTIGKIGYVSENKRTVTF